ncbi:MSCRAMM family protein [Niabella aurantiaca]|uniref:MSCRAMM family protein n=1 Tax=Niabella aurantiaca TaxID=379900 RepID=UPI0012F9AAB4|nr:hypothetical protein [Niabella aurantiaca]
MFCAFLPAVFSFGQQQKVSFSFAADTVVTRYGETFSNKLLISNHTKNPLVLVSDAHDSLALIGLPDTVRLGAGEKRQLFVKYLAGAALLRAKGNKIIATYLVAGEAGFVQASFFISTPSERPLFLSSANTANYLSASSNEGRVQLHCVNNGYQSITFRLLLQSYPGGLTAVDNDRMITLPPGGQQWLTLNLRNRLVQNYAPDFNLVIRAVDPSSGEELATAYTKVLTLGSEKSAMTISNTGASLANNMAQLSYWSTNNGFSYHQISTRGTIQPSDNDTLRYHLNLNYYRKPFSGAEMFDSWIAYSNKYFGIQAGNISEELDYSLFGKGIKASVFLDSGDAVSGYYIKNNYLLFSEVNAQREGAAVWAGSYTHSGRNNSSRMIFLTEKDPLTGVQKGLASTRAGWQLNGDQMLQVEAGYSHEMLSGDKTTAKKGYAGGIRYRYQAGRWSLLSDNYYSSPYYGGLRRGALLLQEHMDYHLNTRRHIFVHYEVVSNRPSYLGYYYPAGFTTKTTQYQAGFITAMGHWLLNIHPYFFTQELHQTVAGAELVLRSASWHGAADVSYSKKGHSLMLTTDYGKVRSNNAYLQHKNYPVWQWRLNYNNRLVGFNALLQHNPYYLMQEPMPWQRGQFRQYALGPYVHFFALKKKLEAEAAHNLSYYGYSGGWSHALQSKLGFHFGNTWVAAAQVSYNTYPQHPHYNFLQAQLSITKSFMQKNAPGYKSLSFLFFGDANANGIWDKDEVPVENVIAGLDRSLARSNRKGKVSFTNLKPATYQLRIQNGNGWWLPEPLQLSLTRNQTLRVGLIKTVVVSGKVLVEKNAYLQEAPSLEGITIIAADQQGNRRTTLTDAAGCFSFNLPVKPFTFSVDTHNGRQLVTGQQQAVDVKEQHNALIIFSLADHSRKVNIRQF